MRVVGTGFASVDNALGRLITGDNVVWLGNDGRVYDQLCVGFHRNALDNGLRVLRVAFGTRPTLERRTARRSEVGNAHTMLADIDHLEATGRTRFARPGALADELDRRFRSDPPDCVIVDDLAGPLRRWGSDATLAFFSRVCPSMLEAGVTAYWSVGAGLSRAGLDSIRQITQCFVDVREGRLRVLKTEGRWPNQHGASYRLSVGTDGDVEATITPGGGRLARGLVALRSDLGMTQQELAAIAGVTASAISQAEGGSRGLSVDTLLHISDRLAIPIDRIINASTPPAYHLARHDRSRRAADGSIALAPDTTVGMRVFLVELPGGAVASPDQPHQGVEVIAAVQGLVQIDLGSDRPVLRSGDTLVVEHAVVASWRNLRADPASFFRVLRD